MKKYFLNCLILVISFFCILHAKGQTVPAAPKASYKIAVFAPLYLDSVFNSNNNFRYTQGIPRFMSPALDFIQGAQVALDSLVTQGNRVEAFIYDSKAYIKNVPFLIGNKKLDSMDLIIGSVRDDEYRQLADFALDKKIPFISATYPNDAGITGNPYLVIMNSTLKAHCDAIYTYLLQNHGTDKIYLFRQAGQQEDMVAGYFRQMNEPDGKPLLNIQTINAGTDLSAAFVKSKLDSNSNSVIIGGSLDENFATNITGACNAIHKTYPVTLIGMPTWDGFTALRKKNPDFLPVYYTTPYYNSKWDMYSKMVMSAYTKKYKGKPGDMAFKGFEAVYLFTKLLLKYPEDFMNHLNDPGLKIINEYNFRAVSLKKESGTTDYYENKHLYFIKIQNGVASRAW